MLVGDGVKAFKDVRAKTMIPLHYGNFDAAEEPLDELEKILRKLENDAKLKMSYKY